MRNHGKWLEKQNIHMVLFSMLYTGRGTPDKRKYEIEAYEDSRIGSGLCVIPVSRRSGIMTHHVKAAIQGDTGFLVLLTCAEKL